jgi:uncharacterized protein
MSTRRVWVWAAATTALTSCNPAYPDGQPPMLSIGEPAPSLLATAAPTSAPVQPLLWHVHSAAGPTYLYGTMHAGIDALAEVPAVVWQRLADCRELVMEVDPDSVEDEALSVLTELPPGTALDRLLTAEQWTRVTALTPGVSRARLRRLKPWVVISLISQSMLPNTPPMDATILREARERRLAVRFLETMPEQVRILDRALTAAELAELVDNEARARRELRQLARAYRAGDARAIAGLLFETGGYARTAQAVDALIVGRSTAWLPEIERRIRGTGRAFIAIGVAHLLGDGGLVTLLRRRGYRVTRVSDVALPSADHRFRTALH